MVDDSEILLSIFLVEVYATLIRLIPHPDAVKTSCNARHIISYSYGCKHTLICSYNQTTASRDMNDSCAYAFEGRKPSFMYFFLTLFSIFHSDALH